MFYENWQGEIDLYLTKYNAMKTYGGVEVQLRAFLTSVLDGSEWSASAPGKGARSTHWIEGWVGPGAGLDAMAKRENPFPFRVSKPVRPVRRYHKTYM
jgi:hypothetical protein